MARTITYQPALDGVRAVSVMLVLAFHLGAPWMPGGYLGVSVFFTLSGFLITTLLLEERERTGRIDVPAFYVRRLRRLLPASLLCLTLVSLLAGFDAFAARSDLDSSVLASLFQVANWNALLADRSYADLFVAPSPVDHFWSLAIEEQFYLLWPAVIVGLTALAARRSARQTVRRVLLAAFAACALSAPITAWLWSSDAAYFASWTRFAEILAGAALAAVLLGRTVPARMARLAPACLASIVGLSMVTPAGRGWAYAGGLPLFALVSAGLILSLQVPSPVRQALSWGPIVGIGRISYGLYLFHWPVFAILDEARTGLDGVALASLRLAATFAITCASFWLIEQPVRAARLVPRPGAYVATAMGGVALVAVAALVLVPSPRQRPADDGEVVVLGAQVERDDATAATATGDASGGARAATTIVPPRPTTVAVFGDSLADWMLRDSALSFDRTDVLVVDAAHEACDAAVDQPEARHHRGGRLVPPSSCRSWPEAYPEVVENPARPVDEAVLLLGQAPMVDRLVEGRWVGPCQTMSWYVDDLAARIAYLRRHVGEVVLALPAWGSKNVTWYLPGDHLERMACVRSSLTALTDRLDVRTVDLAELLCPAGPTGPCADQRDRDGLHLDPEDAPAVLDWLLDEVLVEREDASGWGFLNELASLPPMQAAPRS